MWKQGQKLEKGTRITISRTDPDVDAWKEEGKITKMLQCSCVVSFWKNKIPLDIDRGFWRLDLKLNQGQLEKQVSCIYECLMKTNGANVFATNVKCIFLMSRGTSWSLTLFCAEGRRGKDPNPEL